MLKNLYEHQTIIIKTKYSAAFFPFHAGACDLTLVKSHGIGAHKLCRCPEFQCQVLTNMLENQTGHQEQRDIQETKHMEPNIH